MKVNIGKNTLGDNNKMSLGLKEYGRSSHDLSYAWRSTMGVGVLTPFMRILALPGDTFEIDLQNKILTAPTIGPLFGSFKFQADVFTCPIRLYNAMLHNNALNVGLDMAKVKLPKISMERINNNGYHGGASTSSLKNYLEYRTAEPLNAVPFLAYFDIFKNYYANKQEDKFYMYSGITPTEIAKIISSATRTNIYGAIQAEISFEEGVTDEKIEGTLFEITDNLGKKFEIEGIYLYGMLEGSKWVSNMKTPGNLGSSFSVAQLVQYKNRDKIKALDGGSIDTQLKNTNFIKEKGQGESIRKIEAYDLTQIDDIREYILSQGKKEVIFNQSYQEPNFVTAAKDKKTTKEDLGGLVLKTYQSDIFNNWINKEWIDGDNGIAKITAIDTSSGSFTLDTLNLSKKVYEMLNRIAVSGGSYKDWIETIYTTDYYFRAETPVYEGGMSSEIEFEEIVSNSASNVDEYEPLGTLAGRGRNNDQKGGKIIIKVNEPCYIMGIASITPRVDYSQGKPFDYYLNTINDLHKPQLDGIGYQDLLLDKMDWRGANNTGIGKQPAWIDYTTNFNKTFGKFAAGEEQEYMVLNRVYETKYGGRESNTSTYIDPSLYNKIFATTGNQEQNFWVQIGARIEARRVMAARQIPNF